MTDEANQAYHIGNARMSGVPVTYDFYLHSFAAGK
jgi:hypothetical protein